MKIIGAVYWDFSGREATTMYHVHDDDDDDDENVIKVNTGFYRFPPTLNRGSTAHYDNKKINKVE